MIYAKTASGVAAMHDRSAGLTPRQRSAFIMFDGKRDSSEILKMTAGVGVGQSDLDHLISLGLLAESGPGPVAQPPADPTRAADVFAALGEPVSSQKADGRPTLSAQAHYSMAYPIATRLTAALGLRGFRLNLAVEAAGDLDKLKELSPRIKEAVGAEKFQELDDALNF
jgi:hypothetical protein